MSRPRVAILLSLLLTATVVSARGNAKTVRVDVSGGDLSKPISITNSGLLQLSHVYAGQFLGDRVDGVEAGWPRFDVRLVFVPEIPSAVDASKRTERAYVLHYSLNRQTGEGYVYLPGPGEAGYRDNAGVMLRDGDDGHWHRAGSTWSGLLNPYLQ
jgi:hypothetical protein